MTESSAMTYNAVSADYASNKLTFMYLYVKTMDILRYKVQVRRRRVNTQHAVAS